MTTRALVALSASDGSPLLAWGSDNLVADASRLGFRALVLTAEGSMHESLARTQPDLQVLRCPMFDRGTPEALATAREQLDRCAPVAADLVRRGIPTLVTDARGENRVALMTARIWHLVTGRDGASIYRDLRATPRDDGRIAFTNGAFGREVQSWPAFNPESGGGGKALAIVGVVALLAALGWAVMR